MKLELPVTGGRLACPLAGTVDVERCLHCTWTQEIRSAGVPVEVICSPKVPDHEILSHRGVWLPIP